jgi:hypothetical protein
VSQDEQPGEATLPTVVFMHLTCDSVVETMVKYMKKMPCKVATFCLLGQCSPRSDLMLNLKPNDGNVLFVFTFQSHVRTGDRRSQVTLENFDLVKFRSDLRRVVFSPYPQNIDSERNPKWMIENRDRAEEFNLKLKAWCVYWVTNYRILYPDSLPINDVDEWDYDIDNMPDHVKEKLTQMIFDLATNPKAEFETHVGSSPTDEVRTNIC